jgi:hypothetical protein
MLLDIVACTTQPTPSVTGFATCAKGIYPINFRWWARKSEKNFDDINYFISS